MSRLAKIIVLVGALGLAANIGLSIYDYWFAVEVIEVPHGQREEHR